jgi:hypothetical protein
MVTARRDFLLLNSDLWRSNAEMNFFSDKINKSVALQALTNLGRLSSRRWQSFPTAPDGTGLTCGQAHRISQLHFQLSKPDRYFFIQITTQFIRSRG